MAKLVFQQVFSRMVELEVTDAEWAILTALPGAPERQALLDRVIAAGFEAVQNQPLGCEADFSELRAVRPNAEEHDTDFWVWDSL